MEMTRGGQQNDSSHRSRFAVSKALLPPVGGERIALRWTIGDVHPRGFEMLRLSITCAHTIFGAAAEYLVCVNSLPVRSVRALTGALPVDVKWREVSRDDLPVEAGGFIGGDMVEGMGWKLAPLQTHPDCFEIALDNDCILWAMPEAMRRWLNAEQGSLFAEDVDRCLGVFDALCIAGPLNAGIRGLRPGTDATAALAAVLEEISRLAGGPIALVEIDEQGLQAALVTRLAPVFVVKESEVAICSPFWPHSKELGTCGAHLVGLNSHHVPWKYFDRPADEMLSEHWAELRPALYALAGLRLPEVPAEIASDAPLRSV